MSLASTPTWSGGCQCGAVRFRVEGALDRPSLCHCRMCQKAFGAFYAPLASIGDAKLSWTRGEPKRFQSSTQVRRGFCEACGTPLTYETPTDTALSIGSFDDPASVRPELQFGREAAMPFVDDLPALPVRPLDGGGPDDLWLRTNRSFQHPDYDTDRWPPTADAGTPQ